MFKSLKNSLWVLPVFGLFIGTIANASDLYDTSANTGVDLSVSADSNDGICFVFTPDQQYTLSTTTTRIKRDSYSGIGGLLPRLYKVNIDTLQLQANSNEGILYAGAIGENVYTDVVRTWNFTLLSGTQYALCWFQSSGTQFNHWFIDSGGTSVATYDSGSPSVLGALAGSEMSFVVGVAEYIAPPQPPVAIGIVPVNAIIGNYVTFDGTQSTSTFSDIVSYTWSFGDGATSTGSTTQHIYGDFGAFEWVLTVTDAFGSTSTDDGTVVVNLGEGTDITELLTNTKNTADTVEFLTEAFVYVMGLLLAVFGFVLGRTLVKWII